MKKKIINYKIDSETFLGFAAYPDATKFPAVIIAHTNAGRDEFIDEKAKEIATMGYLGFALDMYGDGEKVTNREEKMEKMRPLLNDRAKIVKRVNAAYNKVKTISGVDKSKIAIFGYCFGGLVSLDLARSGAKLKGCASFHGFLNNSDQFEDKSLTAKILIMHGMQDPMVGQDQLDSFYQEMNEKKADWQLHIFGDSMHSFTNPEANDPVFGAVYSELADKRSWLLLKDFLREVLA